MRKSLGFLVLLGLVGFAPPAHAGLILAGDIDGSAAFCATDNNTICLYGTQLLDTNMDIGTLSLDEVLIGGLLVNGSLHTATAGSLNILDSSSLSILNTSGAAVTVEASISATDFTGPVTEAYTTGSGTWCVNSQGSSTTYTWWNDPTNQQGATFGTDRPGLLVDTFSDTANLSIDSYSHNGGPFPVFDPALFSMTLGFDMTLLSGDSLLSRGQSEIKPMAVPDGGFSSMLLGFALMGLAAAKRRL